MFSSASSWQWTYRQSSNRNCIVINATRIESQQQCLDWNGANATRSLVVTQQSFPSVQHVERTNSKGTGSNCDPKKLVPQQQCHDWNNTSRDKSRVDRCSICWPNIVNISLSNCTISHFSSPTFNHHDAPVIRHQRRWPRRSFVLAAAVCSSQANSHEGWGTCRRWWSTTVALYSEWNRCTQTDDCYRAAHGPCVIVVVSTARMRRST